MHHATLTMQILDCLDELLEVVAGEHLREAASFVCDFDEGKEIALLDKLQHDEKYLDYFSFLFLDDLTILCVVFHESDYVGVFERLE